MKSELEIAIALFTFSMTLLGFLLGRATSRRPHEKRSKITGRFIAKSRYFWAGTNIPKDGPR